MMESSEGKKTFQKLSEIEKQVAPHPLMHAQDLLVIPGRWPSFVWSVRDISKQSDGSFASPSLPQPGPGGMQKWAVHP